MAHPLFPKWPSDQNPNREARLAHHEAVTAALSEQITALAIPHPSTIEKLETVALPWLRILSLIVIGLLAMLGHLSPETASKAAKTLIGG